MNHFNTYSIDRDTFLESEYRMFYLRTKKSRTNTKWHKVHRIVLIRMLRLPPKVPQLKCKPWYRRNFTGCIMDTSNLNSFQVSKLPKLIIDRVWIYFLHVFLENHKYICTWSPVVVEWVLILFIYFWRWFSCLCTIS